MHLIYNFFLGLLQKPTKNKTKKNHTLDTSNVNSFPILFKYNKPWAQKCKSWKLQQVPIRVFVAIRFNAIQECDFHQKKLMRKVVAQQQLEDKSAWGGRAYRQDTHTHKRNYQLLCFLMPARSSFHKLTYKKGCGCGSSKFCLNFEPLLSVHPAHYKSSKIKYN